MPNAQRSRQCSFMMTAFSRRTPARHDVARRVDCAFLARMVIEHRLDEDEAVDVAHDLTYGLVKKAYRL